MSLMALHNSNNQASLQAVASNGDLSVHLSSSVRPDQVRNLNLLPEQIESSPELMAYSQSFLEEFKFVRGGLRDSSWDELQNKWSQFFNFCLSNGYKPLPAKHEVVFEYIKHRGKVLHRSTLKRDMWAINRIHDAAGFREPCKDQAIRDFVKRVSEDQAANGLFITQAEALTSDDLNEVEQLWLEMGTVMSLRDRAILGLMFCCLLRGSELRNVKFGHVNKKNQKLLIPITKTNHSGKPDIAPINSKAMKWLNDYIAAAGDFSEDDYLFRGTTSFGKITKSGKKQMSHSTLVRVFERAFEIVAYRKKGLKKFSCHSARVGCCQALWAAGVKIERIMKLGRWATEEMAYRYGRDFIIEDDALDMVMG
ncbi:tyrosine-type recombinase/integrase [Vibrio sp. 10N.239.312.D08]|uniref:tyrosine-type recombinase/integrase n=1 Tax=Vibrio sp. 10N.239.312.D08 TaxID=3229978 RepID=UPI00354C2A0B